MRVPEIKRAADLNHVSEGWPSFSDAYARKLRISFVRISIYLTLVGLVFAILAVRAMSGMFSGRFVTIFAGQQLVGPVFLLLVEGFIAYCVFCRKRVPFWLLAFGWIGTFGMLWFGDKESHGISHELFNSCGGYGELLLKLAASIALSIGLVWLLEFRYLRGTGYDILKMYADWKMTRNTKRFVGLLAIFGCWLGTLYFFEVL